MKDTQRSTTTIEVTPGTELATALEEGRPVVLVKDGVRYRVDREDTAEPTEDIWANYDPERVLRVLDETAGSWQEIDTEALIVEIHEQRGQDSDGRPA
ncbi:MAG: hypothetical protein M3Q03_03470 [Chloroflexota bacterium]|nr:hypothetical protein [Chloroflexota bacterium]